MTKQSPSQVCWGLSAALAVALGVAGCDRLLEVHDPDIVTPGDLTDESGLAALRNGALSNFQQAWSAGRYEDNIVVASGLLTDEWMLSGLFVNRRSWDRRAIQDADDQNGLFFRLQRARADLERTAIIVARSVPDASADARIPEMLTYAGYTYLGFGESYCSGVPFSESVDAIVYGEPLTTSEIFGRAVDRFDAALDHAAIEADVARLASVGKARALLDLDRAAEAAAVVAAVPDEWVRYNYHSAAADRTMNGIQHFNDEVGRWSIADNEGGNGLPFRSSGDPRVPWTDLGLGLDGQTPLYRFDVYQARTDRFPLASGVEARLIEAEAMLRDGGDWLAIMNDLRAAFGTLGPLLYPDHPPSGTLAPLMDPGSPALREDLLFYERAFWLFSTAHRLGDLRRLVRQYGRNAEDVFPTGAYFKGGAYGSDVNFPVPLAEQNNPNFTQCLDRNP